MASYKRKKSCMCFVDIEKVLDRVRRKVSELGNEEEWNTRSIGQISDESV